MRDRSEIVQIDKCLFSPNKMANQKIWAPKNQPFKQDSRWPGKGYTTVIAAVSQEQGFIEALFKESAGLTASDVVRFLEYLW